jgi:hypothetical protein
MSSAINGQKDRQVLFSICEIAQEVGEPFHRVGYAIESRDIQPITTTATSRMFDQATKARVADILREIDERKRGEFRW